jgi:hypothetical protein
VYQVEYAPGVQAQLATFPPAARRLLEEAIEQLRRDPWQGQRYRDHPPEFRTWTFGRWGLVVYVIHERRATLVLLDTTWAG